MFARLCLKQFIGKSIFILCLLTEFSRNQPGSVRVDAQHDFTKLSSNNNNIKSANDNNVNDILKDTMLLLDTLDQKLTTVNNKAPNALMKDNLRLLDLTATNDSQQLANKTEIADHKELAQRIDDLFAASSTVGIGTTQSSVNVESIKRSAKKGRQLIQFYDDSVNQLAASDSTERHIKFTLDLMQAVFANQLQSSKTGNNLESFLISPLSIQSVLMMMHLGARGQTKAELGHLLHLVNSPTDELAQAFNHPSSTSGGSSKPTKRRQQVGQAAIDPLKQQAATTSSQQGKLLAQQVSNQSRPQQQISSPNNAHELFGNSVKNLLKDLLVTKALTSANQIFVQKNLPLSAHYDWATRHYYGADIKLVDFQHQTTSNPSQAGSDKSLKMTPSLDLSSSQNVSTGDNKGANITNGDEHNSNIQQFINDWVERQTRGKITNFLSSPVPTSTLMMAINVLYFKGDWQFKFDPSDTEQDAWFTKANGQTVKLPMMVNRLPVAFAHDSQMKTSVIELPYKAQRLGLFLLLPDEVSGIFNTMQMLNSSSFANLISSMRKPTTTVPAISSSSSSAASNGNQFQLDQLSNANGINVRIPKFSIESSPRLSQVLSQQLGLKSLFSSDLADLSAMFAPISKRRTTQFNNNNSTGQQVDQHLRVGLDELLHKAVLQVDEQGSVAAASSATIVERVGSFNSNYFEADHPFLLFLMDKQTGLVLFSGVFAGNTNSNDLTNGTGESQQSKSVHDHTNTSNTSTTDNHSIVQNTPMKNSN